MALFPAWNGSQGARPPASFACQAFCFVAIRRKRQAVDKVRSAGGIIGCSIIRASLTPCCFRFARSIVAVHLRVALRFARQPTWQALPSAPAGVRAASQSLMPWHFLQILRVPAGRKKRGFLPKRGFFNGLASLLQETVQALVRCGKAASISCFFLFL